MSESSQHRSTQQIKEAVRSQFGKNAKQYVTSEIHSKGNDLRDLIESIDFQEGMKALDIATGGGHVANALAPHVNEVTALDLTQEILAQARSFIHQNNHHNVSFVQGDAEQLPFKENQFDLVTCRIAAHHFPSISSFVKEVHRVLKSGGQFVLIDNVSPETEELDQFYNVVEKRRDFSHVRAWKKTEWIKVVEENDLQVIYIRTYEKSFEFNEWCKRMQLPSSEQDSLSAYMRSQNPNVKKYFQIEEANDRIVRFTGKSMLLYAMKA